MKDIQQLYTDHILSFLDDVTFINEKSLERAAKVPSGTIALSRTGSRLIPKNGIYQILFELARFGITDINGYRLTPDTPTFCIIGMKSSSEVCIEHMELTDGSAVKREVTDEMHWEEWEDPYEGRVLSSRFEYLQSVDKVMYTSYFDLL